MTNGADESGAIPLSNIRLKRGFSTASTYDTGRRVILGEIRYEGLSRYSRDLAERYSDVLKPGVSYREADVLALQSALQKTPYFSSVGIELLPAEGNGESDMATTVTRPVLVQVREQRPHFIGIGAGFSSNTGFRVETSFRTADLFRRGWELQSGIRIEQKRQSAYADIFLPPNDKGSFDSFGIDRERTDIENLITDKLAYGVVRARQQGALETRHSLNWISEKQKTDHGEPTTNNALTPNTMWTWRKLDSMAAPRHGSVAMAQIGGGAKAALSDQNFLRLNARLQWFLPVGERDVFSVRGELGSTLAPSRENIPADWLFRTGGAQTVRGYRYKSLGVNEGNAVLGGRYLAVASAEYTHWLDNGWGVAAFVDAGDARDDIKGFKLATGTGLGARWKSPVGPIGVDVAYGWRTEEWQLHFSLAIPF